MGDQRLVVFDCETSGLDPQKHARVWRPGRAAPFASRSWYKRLGAFLPAQYLIYDSLQLALWHFERARTKPESFKLADLCAHFGIELGTDAHDALADVRATAQLIAHLTDAAADAAA